MAINKVVLGGSTLIDLTGDTLTAEDLVTGILAHDKSGAPITGNNPYAKAATDAAVNTQTDLIAQITAALEGKAGGGGKMASGSITPSTDAEALQTIQHDLGEIPNFVVFIAPDAVVMSGKRYVKGVCIYAKDVSDATSTISAAELMTSTTSGSWTIYGKADNGGLAMNATNFSGLAGGFACIASNNPEQAISLRLYYGNYPTYLLAGYTYYWIAGVIK